ncbi:ARID DNA-binding domain-containing protein [Tanacetum coccineum]
MKKLNEGIEKNGNRSETEKAKNEVLMASKPSVSIKYPESIHFETKCMLKGTDQGHWDNICLGGYLGVYFGNEFGKIGEILGLSKQDGEEIKRCYINYLDVFTSYYKTARVTTRNVEEGNGFNCLTSHQSDFAEIRTPNVEVAKGKEKMEHFGIELEDTSYESDNLSPIHPSIKGRQTMSKDNQGVIKGPIKLESEVKEDSNSSSTERRLGGADVPIVVSESGWPSTGDNGATMENAETYYTNLIAHVKRRSIETYLFAMFDEDQKPGEESEKHFGVFFPNQSSKYNLSF